MLPRGLVHGRGCATDPLRQARATLYFSDPPQEYEEDGTPLPSPERKLRFGLIIENEDGTRGKGDVDVASNLTAGTLGSLLAALVKLRDAALIDAGYIKS